MGLRHENDCLEGFLVDDAVSLKRDCMGFTRFHNRLISNRPEIPRVLFSQFVGLRLSHALDEVIVVTSQLLLVVALEVEVHK